MTVGYTYDASGDVTNDGPNTYTYDAEGRITAVTGVGVSASYVYNAEGQRVRRTNSGVSVDYLYDLAGHVITELSSTGGWNRGEIYAGGTHIATYQNSTTYFTHSDWLGTERVRSALNGTVNSQWTSYPFGEGLRRRIPARPTSPAKNGIAKPATTISGPGTTPQSRVGS